MNFNSAETQPGSRARFAQLYYDEVGKLPGMQASLEFAGREVAESREAIAEWKRGFTERPLLERAGAYVLNFLRIFPLVPSEITQRYSQAEAAYTRFGNTFTATMKDINFYGSNLPGEHDLRTLNYDAVANCFVLGFFTRFEADGQIDYISVEGSFESLRYRTVVGRKATVRIPETDSLSPVLYVPQKKAMKIFISGYDGPGAIDREWILAVWKPRTTSVPTPIDAIEFQLLD